MEEHIVKINSIEKVTHNVLRIVTEKPLDYKFNPGQATEISINMDGWKSEKRPFTFTCLPEDNYLEFTIKTYPEKGGVTNKLLELKAGDELILHEVFGEIAYKGEGVFIAGGAGITPFIAILRKLASGNLIGANKLIFANKRKEDIILELEFNKLLGANFINILSDENIENYGYYFGQITEDFISKNTDILNSIFYVCGPPPMLEAVVQQLSALGVKAGSIVKEGI